MFITLCARFYIWSWMKSMIRSPMSSKIELEEVLGSFGGQHPLCKSFVLQIYFCIVLLWKVFFEKFCLVSFCFAKVLFCSSKVFFVQKNSFVLQNFCFVLFCKKIVLFCFAKVLFCFFINFFFSKLFLSFILFWKSLLCFEKKVLLCFVLQK